MAPKARKRKLNGGKKRKTSLKEANEEDEWEIDEIGPLHLSWGIKKTKKTNGEIVNKYYSKLINSSFLF